MNIAIMILLMVHLISGIYLAMNWLMNYGDCSRIQDKLLKYATFVTLLISGFPGLLLMVVSIHVVKDFKG